jgi:ubiquinone/menaquinone biosynthesis C-methylase UbiE
MDLQQLAAQLRKPEGDVGKQVGEVMNKGNRLINQWAIEALKLQDNDRVLEIGMGNGAFVSDILNQHASITYHGVDYSSTMVEESLLLNKKFIQEGRASFITGDAKNLPFEDGFFSKIFTVNTIYFWEDAQAELSEIKRVLQPGGTVVFAIRTKNTMEQMPFTEYGFNKYSLEQLTALSGEHFMITEAYEKQEPAYEFNGQPMLLENAIVSCTR